MKPIKPKLMFKEKNVYGRVLFYPENETAKTICLVADKKTLTFEQVKKLETSFNVEIFQDYTYNQF